METKAIVEELGEIRQMAETMYNDLDGVELDVKNRLPEIMLNIERLQNNITNQDNREMKAKEKLLVNEMPKTKEEWFDVLNKDVRVLGQTTDVFGVYGNDTIAQGILIKVDLTRRVYDIKTRLDCYSFLMDKTEAFEFINKPEIDKNIPELKSEVPDISQ